MEKEKILVSSCLLGNPVRYDGKGQEHGEVLNLSKQYEIIPFCPEVAGGLSIPRTPAEIIGNRVINQDGQDVTLAYEKGADLALKLCQYHGISKAVLKARSPSCGRNHIYDGKFNGTLVSGHGVTAKLLLENGIAVYSEEDLGGLFK